jgi:cardiolipin synthase A/B
MYYNWTDTSFYKTAQNLRWHLCNADFFDYLVQMIDSAQESIQLQYYIIDPDSTGIPVLTACRRAAERGVSVKLLADGFGSDKLTDKDEATLKLAGVDFRFFRPLITSGEFYVGRRMHHKILIVDEKIGVVGGMNIADRYKGIEGNPAWIDYAVSVEGEVCKDLTKYCNKIFNKESKPSIKNVKNPFKPTKTLDTSKSWVRLRVNDALRGKREISNSYNRATRRAAKSIVIVGGYFLPGRRYRRNLIFASRKGVEIRVILTKNTDVKLAKYASDYLYNFLMRNKVRIFESNNAMVHGKVAIVDDMFTTIGSYNQNNLSAMLSLEANIDVIDADFSTNFRKHLDSIIDNECTEITPEYFYRKSTIAIKIRRWVSYKLLRISLRILLLLNRIFVLRD